MRVIDTALVCHDHVSHDKTTRDQETGLNSYLNKELRW